MGKPLEDIVVKESTGGLRAYIADTLGALTYNFAVGSTLKYVSGVPMKPLLISAGVDAIINLTTGRLYGKWRDYLKNKFKIKKESGLVKNYCTEIGAGSSFYLPLGYATLLACLTPPLTALKTIGAAAGVFPVTLYFLGKWQDFMRKIFGVNKQEPQPHENTVAVSYNNKITPS